MWATVSTPSGFSLIAAPLLNSGLISFALVATVRASDASAHFFPTQYALRQFGGKQLFNAR